MQYMARIHRSALESVEASM